MNKKIYMYNLNVENEFFILKTEQIHFVTYLQYPLILSTS